MKGAGLVLRPTTVQPTQFYNIQATHRILKQEPDFIQDAFRYKQWHLKRLLNPKIEYYSIVKDSSADLGLISRLSKIDQQSRLSAPKFQKSFFAYFVNILIFLRENKEVSFFLFWIFKLKQPWANPKLSEKTLYLYRFICFKNHFPFTF